VQRHRYRDVSFETISWERTTAGMVTGIRGLSRSSCLPLSRRLLKAASLTMNSFSSRSANSAKMPKTESDLPEWQAAIEVLMLCSRGGDTMLARIGVMKALNRHVERVFNPERKDNHRGKRKLKRDQ
jgi:hypothetical protein